MAMERTPEVHGAPELARADHRTQSTRGVVATLYRALVWLTLAGLVAQVYLAGAGAFGARTYTLHATWGTALSIPVLLLLVLAFLGRVGRVRIGFTALLLLLYTTQLVLAGMRSDAPYVAALHPVNALALLGVTFFLARAQGTARGG